MVYDMYIDRHSCIHRAVSVVMTTAQTKRTQRPEKSL